jgi:polyferredoxin
MKFQAKRLLSQIFIFFSANLGVFGVKTGFCYPFFYCHACPSADAACPLRAIEIGVFKGNVTMNLLFYPFLILGFIGVVSGRAVCGWGCPIGLLQRCTGGAARRLKEFSLMKRIGGHEVERYLRFLKYFNLVVLVIATPFVIGFMFTDLCPVGFLTGTIPISILNPGGYVPSLFFFPSLVVSVLFIVLIFTIERGWCRYFCPVGAILAPFNKISKLHVSVDTSKCIHCDACSEVCPMGVDVPAMKRDPECILCGKCIDVCPKKIISYTSVT